MRNVVTINLANVSDFNVMNAGTDTNQLILYLLPDNFQKTNLRIQIEGSNGETLTSGTLITSLGESKKYIDYEIPIDYWQKAGQMQVKLLSNEGTSETITFTILADIVGDASVKYDSRFTIVSASNITLDNLLNYPGQNQEVNTGMTYIDGKPIYRTYKYINMGSSLSVNVDISSLNYNFIFIDPCSELWSAKGSDQYTYPVNYPTGDFAYGGIHVWIHGNILNIEVGSSFAGWQNLAYIVLLYTKKGD